MKDLSKERHEYLAQKITRVHLTDWEERRKTETPEFLSLGDVVFSSSLPIPPIPPAGESPVSLSSLRHLSRAPRLSGLEPACLESVGREPEEDSKSGCWAFLSVCH